jgi:hypothetical protein
MGRGEGQRSRAREGLWQNEDQSVVSKSKGGKQQLEVKSTGNGRNRALFMLQSGGAVVDRAARALFQNLKTGKRKNSGNKKRKAERF